MLLEKKHWKKLRNYVKPYIFYMILVVLMGSVVSALAAAPIWLIKYIVNNVLIKKDVSMLYILSIAIIIIFLVKGIFGFCRTYLSGYITAKLIYDLRKDLFDHVMRLSLGFYSKQETGDLMAKFIFDIPQFQNFLTIFSSSIVKVQTIIILIIIIFYKNFKLSLFILVLLPGLIWIIKYIGKKLYNIGIHILEKAGSLNSYLQETFSGIKVIKSFASEDFEKKGFDEENEKNMKANIKNIQISAQVTPLVDLFNSFGIVLILIFGGLQVIHQKISPGDFLAFITAIALLVDPLRFISSNFGQISSSFAGVKRVFELMDIENEIPEYSKSKKIKKIDGNIKFENINFKYNNEKHWILNDINLETSSGEIIALVGKSGSGKSTLVNLIPRFYEVCSGSIKIDNVDIKQINKQYLRENIGIVPQDTFLFNDSIKNNIAYSLENIDDKKVENAAKLANAWEFIEKLPEKLNTVVGERGILLSGGQKQRISIARAILKNPKILILDEATSALDTESEKLVQDALENLMQNRTTFVIAHRLSTVINASKIVVLKDGKILETGTHKELLLKKGEYQKLYNKQFSV